MKGGVMRDHSHHIELTREAAVAGMLRLIDEADAFKPRVEQVSVADSIGRVLARDAVAQVDVPDCLTCNMDSVAVHWSAFEGLAPGQLLDTSAWVRGVDWEFANTGVVHAQLLLASAYHAMAGDACRSRARARAADGVVSQGWPGARRSQAWRIDGW